MKVKSSESCAAGTIHTNSSGLKFKVIKYKKYSDIIVEFIDTKYRANCAAKEILRGAVKDKLNPSIYGFAFIGDGKYDSSNSMDAYAQWKGMLTRCFDLEFKEKWPTYKECKICNEWLNFQNFAKWVEDNGGCGGLHVDKDIKIPLNKTYSPDSCLIVDVKINAFLLNFNPSGGFYERHGLFVAQCSDTVMEKNVVIGRFSTKLEANAAYLSYKFFVLGQMLEVGMINEEVYFYLKNNMKFRLSSLDKKY